ncbi:type II toxin-antitoxin system VapC family toxin [Psychroflexus planctonicus]|uniref:Ribonuclease VapC n=1 Tax=Psychroflexus planctonicus TaxID=1526575 RepID=A0ABQ1SEN7_9FLAO|nr:type II toxin-antitoxin system VapC family toxin [Psychroflexus planctonicus]GGE25724.1 twitching motility protein PilT [Psychroflexus planctonicus]
MKKYLLDTNICIYFLKGQFELHRKIEQIGEQNFYLSEITIAELKYGAENSKQKEKNRKNNEEFLAKFKILPVFPALDIYAKEKAKLKTKGRIIDDFDLLIGATAIHNNLTLVTRNVKDFVRLDNIVIEDWTTD